MNITQAQYRIDHDGYGHLDVTIDGQVADIAHVKMTLLDAGVCFLGAEWEDRVPPIKHPQRPGDVLRGFTDDPRIVRLARDFYTKPFSPGPVLVPTLEEVATDPGQIFNSTINARAKQ